VTGGQAFGFNVFVPILQSWIYRFIETAKTNSSNTSIKSQKKSLENLGGRPGFSNSEDGAGRRMWYEPLHVTPDVLGFYRVFPKIPLEKPRQLQRTLPQKRAFLLLKLASSSPKQTER
jgi:hypothetical protein